VKRPQLKLFFSYAHEDQDVRDELDKHLDVLEREGLITVWWMGKSLQARTGRKPS
jgi:hypothetical protein